MDSARPARSSRNTPSPNPVYSGFSHTLRTGRVICAELSSAGVAVMKQFVLGIATAGALVGVVALSQSELTAENKAAADPNEIKIEVGEKNPWTSLNLKHDPNEFHFAVVSDRT